MSAFSEWEKYIASQRHCQTGCIPTAYEILLRAAHTPGIDFETFQEEFDLDRQGDAPRNNFSSVAEAIQKRYPYVTFNCEGFAKGDGQTKLARVEEFLDAKRPVIVSVANAPFGGTGWHIMVVVDATAENLTLLEYVDPQRRPHTKTISKADFVKIHDDYEGGDDIAYLATHRGPNLLANAHELREARP
jgi:hypothetical protein